MNLPPGETPAPEFDLTVHHLRFTVEVQTFVHLGPQAGAQLRGALWAALQQFACDALPGGRTQPDHAAHCPMCRLVALETAESLRGVNPPRPFAIRPPLPTRPLADQTFAPGETFSFGVNLFGDAAGLFPYVCQAARRMGEIGVGYGRGRFALRQVQAVNPLSNVAQDLLVERRVVSAPGLPVTTEQVHRQAAALPPDRLTLRFLTPTELTFEGRAVTQPQFEVLAARLIERCQALEQHYTPSPAPAEVWRARYLALTPLARAVRLTRHATRWARVESGSRRTVERNSVGGLVGEALYEGDLTPFGPWLIWGQSLNVGKNVVKGNGWYEVMVS